jgi:hypothetical protein
VLSSDIVQDWSDCAAWTTPLCPEINKNRLAALQYKLIEICCCDLDWCAHYMLLFLVFTALFIEIYL